MYVLMLRSSEDRLNSTVCAERKKEDNKVMYTHRHILRHAHRQKHTGVQTEKHTDAGPDNITGQSMASAIHQPIDFSCFVP